MNQTVLTLPERAVKPRTSGLTMVIDGGIPLGLFTDQIEFGAEYIDYVLSRITCIGAGYLALVCICPEILTYYQPGLFYFGGTSLLIVVSVTMDTVAQIQGYLLAHQYEGLIKRSKLRGRRR